MTIQSILENKVSKSVLDLLDNPNIIPRLSNRNGQDILTIPMADSSSPEAEPIITSWIFNIDAEGLIINRLAQADNNDNFKAGYRGLKITTNELNSNVPNGTIPHPNGMPGALTELLQVLAGHQGHEPIYSKDLKETSFLAQAISQYEKGPKACLPIITAFADQNADDDRLLAIGQQQSIADITAFHKRATFSNLANLTWPWPNLSKEEAQTLKDAVRLPGHTGLNIYQQEPRLHLLMKNSEILTIYPKSQGLIINKFALDPQFGYSWNEGKFAENYSFIPISDPNKTKDLFLHLATMHNMTPPGEPIDLNLSNFLAQNNLNSSLVGAIPLKTFNSLSVQDITIHKHDDWGSLYSIHNRHIYQTSNNSHNPLPDHWRPSGPAFITEIKQQTDGSARILFDMPEWPNHPSNPGNILHFQLSLEPQEAKDLLAENPRPGDRYLMEFKIPWEHAMYKNAFNIFYVNINNVEGYTRDTHDNPLRRGPGPDGESSCDWRAIHTLHHALSKGMLNTNLPAKDLLEDLEKGPDSTYWQGFPAIHQYPDHKDTLAAFHLGHYDRPIDKNAPITQRPLTITGEIINTFDDDYCTHILLLGRDATDKVATVANSIPKISGLKAGDQFTAIILEPLDHKIPDKTLNHYDLPTLTQLTVTNQDGQKVSIPLYDKPKKEDNIPRP